MLCFKCLKDVPDKSVRCPNCGQNFSGRSTVEKGPELKEGDKVSHFAIRELIGEGPIARVYKVLDTQFDVVAALKILHPEYARDRAIRTAAQNVFRSLIEFESDGFVKVFDAAEADGKFFIAEDYLEGLSLRRLMEVRSGSGGKFSWEEAEPIIEAVCAALETMNPGEVHGDLKPENVIILPDAVRLTDLGLARIMDPARFVADQVVAGNGYLPPELAEHAGRILTDPAVDVYAVGAIFYQLLTGALPTAAERNPKKRVPEVPAEIGAIVEKALAPNPDERFPHAAHVHLELAKTANQAEQLARIEIFLHDLPDRAPMPKPEAPPPPVAAQPAAPPAPAKPKSLFDDELLNSGEKPAQPKAPVITAASAPKSKTPLFAGIAVVIVLALGIIGFLATRGQEPAKQAAQAPVQPKAEEAKPKQDEAKKQAESAVARAEKSRDDAIAVDASKGAADLFVSGMKALREANEALRDAKYASAVSLAVKAETAFGDAMIKGVSAQQQQQQESKKEERAVKKEAVAAAVVQAPAKPPCPEGMVLIPRGSFVMGSPSSDSDRNPGELYNETLNVQAFCIDKFEYPNKKGSKPTVNVTWAAAKKACEAEGKRLCSETEWEKACKGPSNLKFPYSASFDANKCNTEDSAGNDRTIAPAGKFAACTSGYGVNDMSGNVWEWTDSLLQASGKDRVLRGGSFTRPDYHDRCANRYNSLPTVSDEEFGFRCCAASNQ